MDRRGHRAHVRHRHLGRPCPAQPRPARAVRDHPPHTATDRGAALARPAHLPAARPTPHLPRRTAHSEPPGRATSITTAPTAPRWRTRAACRGANPALFYDPHPDRIAAAKTVCDTCPVRAACRTHAVDTAEEFGVWGGLPADERPAPPPDTAPAPGPAPQDQRRRALRPLRRRRPRPRRARPAPRTRLAPDRHRVHRAARAVRLGVVEHRGRGLYPVRR